MGELVAHLVGHHDRVTAAIWGGGALPLPFGIPATSASEHTATGQCRYNSWALEEDQIRRCLLLGSSNALADQELLQLILSPVLQGNTVVRVSRLLLSKFRTFNRVISASAKTLMALDGLGEDGVVVLKAIHAAAARLQEQEFSDAPIFDRWDQMISYLLVSMGHERSEVFRVLFTDRQNRLIANEVLWQGSIAHVPVYVRDVVKRCLELDAVGLVMAHNHPSGCMEPSLEDQAMTRQIVQAVAVFEVKVFDHIIVGAGQWMSFSENNIL